jgi:DNA primase catalytic core
MARFAESEVERVKATTDLVALVEASGVELARHGEDWIGLCPFHADREPSLVVSPRKGLWHCLGACRSGGSAIDWTMKAHGLTFREAVVHLQSGTTTPARPAARERTRPALSLAARPVNPDLLSRVVAHYRASYQTSAEAKSYAAARGIGLEAAAERFGYGYAGGTLVETLGREHLAELIRLGVVNARTNREHLAGCLVLPIVDGAGKVLNLYGRRLVDVAGSPRHLYLPGARRGVFNPEALATSKELILCEALIDALTFWCHGFRNVTAAYGVNGFTEDLHQAILGAGPERVLIAYDRDGAGDAAAKEVAAKLSGEGIGCWRVLFPKTMDANAYALHVAPAEKSLALVLQSMEHLAGPKAQREAAGAAPVAARAPEKAAARERTPPLAAESPAAPAKPPAPSEPASLLAASQTPRAGVTATGVDPFDLVLGERRWRVRGLLKNLSYEKLSVLVRVECQERVFVDAVDLVSSRQRKAYVHQATVELGLDEEIVRKDLAKVHLALEPLQDEHIRRELQPKAPAPAVAPEAEREALAFLKRPDLAEAILADFDRCGIVGERVNKLLGYLAAVSRKLDRPLAVIVQSSSAAGKSALVESILSLVPEEERVSYSAMTGQSLFYMGETDLKHKVLAIAEEEGAERASYALKLLQSEGELTIASTGKDPQSGKLVTHEYRVEGPVAILLTTTAIDVDEELLNRCLVLTVDEDREQTRAIHARQREAETLEGLLAERERRRIVERHRNAQRLLKPLLVVNPYARQLTFLDDRTRTRRDHVKYLTLIRTIALLHQHQRPRKTTLDGAELVEYVEVELGDIALANKLAHDVLGRSLDELPPQTRQLLRLLDRWIGAECERNAVERADFLFSRRQLREATGWSDAQVRRHLERLVELEYVLVHKATRGQSLVYELVYDGKGEGGGRFLPGLLDVERLAAAGTLTPFLAGLTPSEAVSDPPMTPGLPPDVPGVPGKAKRSRAKRDGALLASTPNLAENALLGPPFLAAASRE